MEVQTQVQRFDGDGTIYIDPEARVVRVQIFAQGSCSIFIVAPGSVAGGLALLKAGERIIDLHTAGPGGAWLVRNEKIEYTCTAPGYIVLLLDVLVSE